MPSSSFAVASSLSLPQSEMSPAPTKTTVPLVPPETVIAEVPLFPSEVAVIVADPAAPPVTRPVPFTGAMLVALLDQVMVRPVSTFPPASFVVAVSWIVDPTATDALAGLTVTVATGGGADAVTVIDAVPLLPSLVAVIVAVPAATPVTSPPLLTVAVPVAPLDQVMLRPVRTLPFASLVVAASWTVFPTATEALAGLTVTVATGGGAEAVTVIVAVPLLPSLVAVIVAVPAAPPETSPLPFTVAVPVAPLDQVMLRPVRTLPFASLVVAASWTVPPTATEVVAGLTVTEATAAGEPLVMVTCDVSATVPPFFVSTAAMTANVPAVDPAVYIPLAVIVPPLAENVALTATLSPFAISPDAENCVWPPLAIETDAGSSTMCLSIPLFTK